MTSVDYIPEGYARIQVVESWEGMLRSEFAVHANVILFPRPQSPSILAGFNRLALFFDAGLRAKRQEVHYTRSGYPGGFSGLEERIRQSGDQELVQCYECIDADFTLFEKASERVVLRVIQAGSGGPGGYL